MTPNIYRILAYFLYNYFFSINKFQKANYSWSMWRQSNKIYPVHIKKVVYKYPFLHVNEITLNKWFLFCTYLLI